MTDRADAARQTFLIGVHDELEAELGGATVAERDHVAELPGGIDVQQRKRQLRRIERLQRQVQENRGILADRIEQHRVVALGDSLPDDVDAFGLELSRCVSWR